jgi:hypothetical protein
MRAISNCTRCFSSLRTFYLHLLDVISSHFDDLLSYFRVLKSEFKLCEKFSEESEQLSEQQKRARFKNMFKIKSPFNNKNDFINDVDIMMTINFKENY